MILCMKAQVEHIERVVGEIYTYSDKGYCMHILLSKLYAILVGMNI